MCRLRVFASLCFVFFFFFVITASCTELATFTGYVTDPSGLRISHCRVQVTNVETNISYAGESNEIGLYRISEIPIGKYRVIVQKSGFKTIIKQDVELHVQDIVALNFQLELGSVAESVTVESGAPQVNTQDGSVSTVVNRQFVENLPLNGRSFQTLIMLTPGVVLTPSSYSNQGQFSINGQRADSNYFTVDGASANVGIAAGNGLPQAAGGSLPAFSALGGTNSLVSVDAMQEFRIQTSSFAPEFGRSPGGQVSIATRSGTNQFHGTLFEYFRNDVLDATDWFADHNGLPKSKERQNEFGGVLGGPILPNRTFFFFSYEGLRLRQPLTQIVALPSVSARQSAPASVQPFLNAFPIPNGQDLGKGLAQFAAGYSNPATLDAYSLRVDHAISDKMILFGRYNYSPSEVIARGSSSLGYNATGSFQTHTFTMGLTHLISQRIDNELRANYSNVRGSNFTHLDSFGGAAPLASSALFPPGITAEQSAWSINILGAGSSIGSAILSEGKVANNEQRQVNFVDNLSIAIGNHQFKFGTDYRWLSPIAGAPVYQQQLVFNGVSGSAGSASSGAAFLAIVGAFKSVTLLSRNISVYGQDTWKVTPRLSLTYGLRWDVNPALKGKNSSSEPLTVRSLSDPAHLALAPAGTPLYETTYANFAPRVGVAYQLNPTLGWESVVRGGFGFFYDFTLGFLGQLSFGFPFNASKNVAQVTLPLTAQQAAPPAFSATPTAARIFVADPHLQLPRTTQWNAALEQGLGKNQSFSITYVGAVGRDLLREDVLQNPNPQFQSVSVTTNKATSDYHALQLEFKRRLSRGLQALASYTWSHSIDIASNDAVGVFPVNTPASQGDPNMDRGNSDFDVRNSVTGALTYDLPTLSSRLMAKVLLNGWSVDNLFTARSALPVNVLGPTFIVSGTQFQARPNLVPGVPFYLSGTQYPGGRAINKAAFVNPPAGQQGTLRRNALRGLGAWQSDFTVRRQFHLSDRIGLQFRTEIFNIFNHPNFGLPLNNISSALFGQSTQTLAASLGSGGPNGGFNPLYQIGGPRSIQLALKLQF